MKKMGILMALFVGVALLAQDAPQEPSAEPLEEVQNTISEVHRIKTFTSFLNLFNGLNLSAEQVEELIRINEEYKAELNRIAEENKERAKKSLEAIKNWESALERGEMPKDLMDEAVKADNLIKEAEEKQNQLKLKYKERLEKVFTEAQKEVIRTFKPCIIPPQDLRNPIRVGQASTNDAAIRDLRRIRSVPQAKFNEVLEKILDGYIDKISKKHTLDEQEANKERERMRALLIKVRNMSDVDFELNKEQLAEEAKYKNKADILREEIARLQKEISEYEKKEKELSGDVPVVRWFLKPNMLPILKKRLAMLKGEPVSEENSREQKTDN